MVQYVMLLVECGVSYFQSIPAIFNKQSVLRHRNYDWRSMDAWSMVHGCRNIEQVCEINANLTPLRINTRVYLPVGKVISRHRR